MFIDFVLSVYIWNQVDLIFQVSVDYAIIYIYLMESS
jgi:hypothetical protein